MNWLFLMLLAAALSRSVVFVTTTIYLPGPYSNVSVGTNSSSSSSLDSSLDSSLSSTVTNDSSLTSFSRTKTDETVGAADTTTAETSKAFKRPYREGELVLGFDSDCDTETESESEDESEDEIDGEDSEIETNTSTGTKGSFRSSSSRSLSLNNTSTMSKIHSIHSNSSSDITLITTVTDTETKVTNIGANTSSLFVSSGLETLTKGPIVTGDVSDTTLKYTTINLPKYTTTLVSNPWASSTMTIGSFSSTVSTVSTISTISSTAKSESTGQDNVSVGQTKLKGDKTMNKELNVSREVATGVKPVVTVTQPSVMSELEKSLVTSVKTIVVSREDESTKTVGTDESTKTLAVESTIPDGISTTTTRVSENGTTTAKSAAKTEVSISSTKSSTNSSPKSTFEISFESTTPSSSSVDSVPSDSSTGSTRSTASFTKSLTISYPIASSSSPLTLPRLNATSKTPKNSFKSSTRSTKRSTTSTRSTKSTSARKRTKSPKSSKSSRSTPPPPTTKSHSTNSRPIPSYSSRTMSFPVVNRTHDQTELNGAMLVNSTPILFLILLIML